MDKTFYGGTQQEIYEETLRDPLARALNGFSSLVMVYGRKSGGKKYTTIGDSQYETRGLIPRALQQLFKAVEARDHELDVRLR